MRAQRALRLDEGRWRDVGPASFWPALGIATVASFAWSLNRFGGALVDEPRSFVRLGLLGIYGWIGLAVAIWAIAAVVADDARALDEKPPSVLHSVAVVGLAHMPVVGLGGVVFIAANLAQVLGPGYVAAVFVLGLWFPAVLVAAAHHSFRLSIGRAALAALIPYLLWLLAIGSHLLGRIQHLL